MSKKKMKKVKEQSILDWTEKQKRLFFLGCIIALSFVFWGERTVINVVEDKMSHLSQKHAEKDIVGVSGYEVHGRSYKLTSDHPEIMIPSKINNIDTVKIAFHNKIKEDTKAVAYLKGKVSEGSENSDQVVEKIIRKGSDSIHFAVPSGEYSVVRLEVFGDFSLNEVQLSGYSVAKLSTVTMSIVWLLDILLISFVVFCYWKKNRMYVCVCNLYESVYNFLKRTELNKGRGAFFVLGAILFSLMICGEKNWLESIKEDVSTVQQKSVSKDAISFQGYGKKGDAFEKIGDDPQIVFKSKISSVSRVELLFREPLKEDMLVQVFYCRESEGWSEENSKREYAMKGSDNISFDIPEKIYDEVRLDLDGDFLLGCVKFSARDDKSIPIWNYIMLALIDGAFILLWGFLGVKKNIIYTFILWIGNHIRKWYFFANRKAFSLVGSCTIRLENVFLILALVLGVAYAVLIPPGQVPDEPNHAYYMLDSFGYGEKMNGEKDEYLVSIGFSEAYLNPAVKQDKAAMQHEMGRKFSPEARKFTHLPSIKMLRYLPAGIGYVLCVSLNMPIFYCLQVAEFCSVIFYAVMGYFALKRLKIMKGALFTVMLLPMTLQQCASLNYDAVLLTSSFWVFSYFVYCITEKEKVGWKDVFVLLLLFYVIASTKPPYAFLFLLFLAVPKEKLILPIATKENVFPILLKYRYVFLGVIFAGGLCFLIVSSGYYVNLIKGVLLDFDHTLVVFRETFRALTDFYLTSGVANFGWLIYPMPELFRTMSYGIMFTVALCSAGYPRKDGTTARIWSAVGVVASAIFIWLAMISWSFFLGGIDAGETLSSFREAYAQIGLIQGVQGRYFIPLVPFCMYAVHDVIRVNIKNHVIPVVLAYGMWIIWPVTSIVHMFWG